MLTIFIWRDMLPLSGNKFHETDSVTSVPGRIEVERDLKYRKVSVNNHTHLVKVGVTGPTHLVSKTVYLQC
jgi:hypothetical protein